MRVPLTARVLATGGALRRVLAGYLLYALVEMAIWLAIILWAFDEGGAGLAGFVAVVQLVPAALLAPPLAGLGDRTSRGTALVAAHLGVAVTTLATTTALLLDAPSGVVIAASAAATTALSVVRPLHFAALPQLVRAPGELVSANALSSMGDGLALFVGPVLAGVGAQVAGPWLVFTVASVVATAATVLCLRTGLPAPAAPSAHVRASGWRSAFAGLGALARDRAVLVLLLVLTTKFVIEGAHDVLGISLSVDALDLGSSGAGVIVGAMGLGGILGGMVAASVADRPVLAPVLLGSGLAQGVGLALVAVLLVFAPIVALLAVAGTGGAVLMVAGRTLLQRTADQRMLARVFAVQEGTALVGLAIGAALAPLLVDRLSPQGAFVPLGLGAALVTTLGFLLVRDLDARAVLLPEETALLRGVQFLSVLPAYDLERLARNATWVEVGAGDDVVVQGDPGDRFYVVGSGELRVTVGGVVRPVPLRPGDYFGEIALLRSVLRTATVTATTSCRLLTLGAEEFLAAVTGSPTGRTIAAEVASSHLARDADRD
jgi:MFS family permease